MDNRPLGIFDSGLGGLSIAQAIWQTLPHESSLYLADHQFCPYGDKSADQIKSRLKQAVEFFLRHRAKLIVLACNTATVTALDYLRHQFDLPFVGTVPAIKPAVKATPKGKIAVLTTSQTAASHYHQQLKSQFDQKNQVVSLAWPGLVAAIESHGHQADKIKPVLQNYLHQLPPDTKTLVLGCTHYILIQPLLQSLLPPSIKIIQPASAIAQQTQRLLNQHQLQVGSRHRSQRRFFTTAADPRHPGLVASSLLGESIIFTSCSF